MYPPAVLRRVLQQAAQSVSEYVSSWPKKLAVAAIALYRVVSAGLKICPINGCSFTPNFLNFLFPTMSSVLSRTSSMLSLDMGFSKGAKLDAPVSRAIVSAYFWSASLDIPIPSC